MFTIAPPPRAFRCGAAAFVVTNVVRRFCASCWSQAAEDISSIPPVALTMFGSTGRRPTPALLTTMSSPPSCSTTVRTAAATSDSTATSHASAIPGAGRAAAVFSASMPSRSSSATRAPWAAITRAIPAPIPRAPPVITATVFVSIAPPGGRSYLVSSQDRRPLDGRRCYPARNPMPPNFIFILADDLGYADLGCYGGRSPCSPELDRLATQGLRFTDGYSNSPVCSPTRFALITGRFQYRLRGGNDEPIA